jgi:hypothetical protein
MITSSCDQWLALKIPFAPRRQTTPPIPSSRLPTGKRQLCGQSDRRCARGVQPEANRGTERAFRPRGRAILESSNVSSPGYCTAFMTRQNGLNRQEACGMAAGQGRSGPIHRPPVAARLPRLMLAPGIPVFETLRHAAQASAELLVKLAPLWRLGSAWRAQPLRNGAIA